MSSKAKSKMEVLEYLNCYITFINHYKTLFDNIDIDILENIDIFNDQVISVKEREEIEKFLAKLKAEKKFFEDEINKYTRDYEISTSSTKFDYGQNIVRYIFQQSPMFQKIIDIFEGILFLIDNKLTARDAFFVNYRKFQIFVLLKNSYISIFKCLRIFIIFLTTVIFPEIDIKGKKFGKIDYSNTKIKNMLIEYEKNILIVYFQKHQFNIEDNFTNKIEQFYINELITPLKGNSRVDDKFLEILEKKYINLLLIKNNLRNNINNIIVCLDDKNYIKYTPSTSEIYQKLFGTKPILLKFESNQNGNLILFGEFIQSIIMISECFFHYFKVIDYPINVLDNNDVLKNIGFFQQSNAIKTYVLPFINDELTYFDEIKKYVDANNSLFQPLQLTDQTSQGIKLYNYIEYIQEQIQNYKIIFIQYMNILYTIQYIKNTINSDFYLNLSTNLFNNICQYIELIYSMSCVMYDAIIFNKNDELLPTYIFYFYLYYSFINLNNTMYMIDKDRCSEYMYNGIQYLQSTYGNSPDLVLLTNGYSAENAAAVSNQDPNMFCGIIGNYYLAFRLKRFYDMICENVDTFKNNMFGFHFKGNIYSIREIVNEYQRTFHYKPSNDVVSSTTQFIGEYNAECIQRREYIRLNKYTDKWKTVFKIKSKPVQENFNDKKTSNKKVSSKTIARLNDLIDSVEDLEREVNKYRFYNQENSYFTRLHKISDYRTFKTQTDREPQDFIAQIKLKNIGGKQNVGKYKYITEDSLGKVANNNRARELANIYNQLTDKMIETEKKIGGIQKLALNDLNKSESGYIRMRGGEQQTINYNNLIKQYQLMAIKQNNIINELKNIKNII